MVGLGTVVPGEKQSGYRGATTSRSDQHRGTAGTPNSSKYQRGGEKN